MVSDEEITSDSSLLRFSRFWAVESFLHFWSTLLIFFAISIRMFLRTSFLNSAMRTPRMGKNEVSREGTGSTWLTVVPSLNVCFHVNPSLTVF